MPGGPEGGGEHQLTDRERESVEHNMSWEMEQASNNRQDWHERSGITDPQTIKEINALNAKITHNRDEITYSGVVKGHSVHIYRINTRDVKDTQATIDGAKLNWRDAEKLFGKVEAVREGVAEDLESVIDIESDNDKSKIKKGLKDIFGIEEFPYDEW